MNWINVYIIVIHSFGYWKEKLNCTVVDSPKFPIIH